MELGIELDSPLPEKFESGRGSYLVLRGRIVCGESVVKSLQFNVSSRSRVELYPLASDESGRSGQPFFAMLEIPERMVGSTLAVNAQITLHNGQQYKQRLGECTVIATRLQPVMLPAGSMMGSIDQPLIAICMATYHPEPAAFRQQIESIVAQSYSNWICIVNDDVSSAGSFREMTEICKQDSRIYLYRNRCNLGFYHNFEQALRRVPEAAQYIAFADQDDNWYKRKLERLLDALQNKAQLAYSDMRIVSDDGSVVAETYWQGRRNEYKDFATVLLANTVTGAASLFRRELLPDLLPFPFRVGDAFHDHWLACVALAKGRIGYVDEALYDYHQHGTSVIGHCDFTPWTLRQRVVSMGRFALCLLKPTERRQILGGKIGSSLAVYRGECLRLELFTRTIKLRLGQEDGVSGALNLFNGGLPSAFKLLGTHLKILITRRTTDDAEFRLAMGYLARFWERRKMKAI